MHILCLLLLICTYFFVLLKNFTVNLKSSYVLNDDENDVLGEITPKKHIYSLRKQL